MKSLFFLPALLLMLSPLTLQAEQVSFGLAEQEKIALLGQAIQARGCPLYQSVRSELQQYYGRSDFSDPDRSTGWYRVDNFLTWLAENEQKLKRESILFYSQHTEVHVKTERSFLSVTTTEDHKFPLCDFVTGKTHNEVEKKHLQKTLGIYLGLRYTQDVFMPKKNLKTPFISIKEVESDGAAASLVSVKKQKKGAIYVGQMITSLAEDINLGLHEGVHLLYWMANREDVMLGETASFYAQAEYGMPVKTKLEEKCFFKGARNFLHSVDEIGSCKDLSAEYAEMLLGIFVYPYLKQMPILALHENFNSQKTISAFMDDMAALSHHRLFEPHPREHSLRKEEISQYYPDQQDFFPQDVKERAFIHYDSFFENDRTLVVVKTDEETWNVKETKEMTLASYVSKLNLPQVARKPVEDMLAVWIKEWQKDPDFPMYEYEKFFLKAERTTFLSPSAENFLNRKLRSLKAHLPPVPKGYI